MKNKKAANTSIALDGVKDGDVILLGGFGTAGVPTSLIQGLAKKRLKELTIVSNGGPDDESPLSHLLSNGTIRKIICTFPYPKESIILKKLHHDGVIEVELVPQGTLAERMRSAGAGLGGFLTRTSLGTEIAVGKPEVVVDGQTYVLEKPLHADVALIKAHQVDPRGNLTYRMTAQNFNPIMATAAKLPIVEAFQEVALGDIDPTLVVTPGIYVDRYVVKNGGIGS